MALIPDRYDVAINGKYYRFADWEQRRALYQLSPTFLPRANYQGDWGDNQFDYWLTWTQRDWQLGEQQRFFRSDESRSRRVWDTDAVNFRTAGQVTMRPDVQGLTFNETVIAGVTRGGVNDNTIVVGAANFHEVAGGPIFNHAAHTIAGLKRTGVASDGSYVYVSAYGDNVVRWSGASTIAFGTPGADALEYLNNTLFGVTGASRDFAQNQPDYAKLVQWDTAGAQTDLFQWKQADGDARMGRIGGLKAYGGDLLILWSDGPNGGELWTYDGSGCAITAGFPKNFYPYSLEVVQGVVFISGSFVMPDPTYNVLRPAIFYWANGTTGVLWRATTTLNSSVELEDSPHPVMVGYDDGLVFTDDTRGRFLFYDPSVGGVHAIGRYGESGVGKPVLTGGQRSFLLIRNSTAAYLYPNQNLTRVATSTVTHSLVDFDSTLNKWFRSVKYHGDVPSGASVDLAYRLEDMEGSYTTIQAGAVSDVEYDIGVRGRAISIRVTLNKGSSSAGPTLKRLFLRAAPIQDPFKRRDYILDISGRDGESHIQLRDGTIETRDGMQLAIDLFDAADNESPVSIIDRFGSYTAYFDNDQFQIVEIRPEEFIAIVRLREV